MVVRNKEFLLIVWVKIYGDKTNRKCMTWSSAVGGQEVIYLQCCNNGELVPICWWVNHKLGTKKNLQWSHSSAPQSAAETEEYLNHNLFINRSCLFAQFMLLQVNGCVLWLSMMSHLQSSFPHLVTWWNKITLTPLHKKLDLFPELHCKITNLIAWQSKLLTLLLIYLFGKQGYFLLHGIMKYIQTTIAPREQN